MTLLRSFLFLTLLLSSEICSALDASVTHAAFRTNDQNYVEIYLQIIGSSVKFIDRARDKKKAAVSVTLLIKRSGEIVIADKFILNSPMAKDAMDFIDLRRYGLDRGSYEIEIDFVDANDIKNDLKVKSRLNVDQELNELNLSDIQLLSSFTEDNRNSPFHKNGYYLEPLPYNFYHRNNQVLNYYCEVYDCTKLGDVFVTEYRIERIENNESETVKLRRGKHKSQPTNVLLGRLDISDLPSGNYDFIIDILNQKGEKVHSRKIDFTRSNPSADIEKYYAEGDESGSSWLGIMSDKELDYSLRALVPIVSQRDIETINYLVGKAEEQYKRNFLFYYWTNQFELDPEYAYNEYMKVARAIDKMFDYGFGHGFESDRGHIYLKYGRPDERINVKDDNGAYPYEIWYYNKLAETGQTNARFIFYNPTLADKAMILLHSTARGERFNEKWEVELYKNAPYSQEGNNYLDGTRVKDNFLRRARELFEN